jgi:hypothetical protein
MPQPHLPKPVAMHTHLLGHNAPVQATFPGHANDCFGQAAGWPQKMQVMTMSSGPFANSADWGIAKAPKTIRATAKLANSLDVTIQKRIID